MVSITTKINDFIIWKMEVYLSNKFLVVQKIHKIMKTVGYVAQFVEYKH